MVKLLREQVVRAILKAKLVPRSFSLFQATSFPSFTTLTRVHARCTIYCSRKSSAINAGPLRSFRFVDPTGFAFSVAVVFICLWNNGPGLSRGIPEARRRATDPATVSSRVSHSTTINGLWSLGWCDGNGAVMDARAALSVAFSLAVLVASRE